MAKGGVGLHTPSFLATDPPGVPNRRNSFKCRAPRRDGKVLPGVFYWAWDWVWFRRENKSTGASNCLPTSSYHQVMTPHGKSLSHLFMKTVDHSLIIKTKQNNLPCLQCQMWIPSCGAALNTIQKASVPTTPNSLATIVPVTTSCLTSQHYSTHGQY